MINNISKTIFMIANYTPTDLSIGITKKISAEIRAFRKLGCSVFYSAYVPNGVAIFNNQDEVVYKKQFVIKNSRYQQYRRYFLLLECVKEFLNCSSENFDTCYGRFSAPSSQYLNLLRQMKNRNMKVLIESLSYFPGMTFKSLKGKYIIKMIQRNEKRFPDCIDYFLTEGDFTSLYGVPAYEVRMGVETDRITPHEFKANPSELHMISVANETMYHGYDRAVRSLSEYMKRPNAKRAKLHLVGVISKETEELIHRLNMEDYVVLYGKRYGEELDEIYNKCNVGIGPLGQHRMGGKKDTGLKTKEYFAKGLPYFYSGQELPELKDCLYTYEVESNDNCFDIDNIWEFYESYRNNNNVVDEMRTIARELFSWESIMYDALISAEK